MSSLKNVSSVSFNDMQVFDYDSASAPQIHTFVVGSHGSALSLLVNNRTTAPAANGLGDILVETSKSATGTAWSGAALVQAGLSAVFGGPIVRVRITKPAGAADSKGQLVLE